MIKVRIENQGDLVHDVRVGRTRFDIPQGVGPRATTVKLPDNELTWTSIERLIDKYPHLSFSGASNNEKEEDSIAKDSEEVQRIDSSLVEAFSLPKEEDIAAEKKHIDPFDTFKTSVTGVEKGSAGWWTVNLKGREPMKVRSATDEESAMRLAFETILEDRE